MKTCLRTVPLLLCAVLVMSVTSIARGQTTTTTTVTAKKVVTAKLSRDVIQAAPGQQATLTPVAPVSVVITTTSAISLTAYVNGRGDVFTGLTIPVYTIGGNSFLGGKLKLVSITGVGVSPKDVGQVYTGLGVRYQVFSRNGWTAQVVGGELGMNLSNGFAVSSGVASGFGSLFIGGSLSIPIGAP